MKEKLKNKKIVYTIIGIVAVLLLAIAITYAYWLITKNQTGDNVITAACLDISLTDEENDITLTNQFPLSDEDGKKLTPYTFTVTNNCNTSVDYQIALETFEGADTISSSAIKVMTDSDTPVLLSTSEQLETRIANATNSYLLKYGTLASKDTEGSSASHTLRIWIDENAPISEMKKTLTSKISVTIGQGITNFNKPKTLADAILTNYGGAIAITEIDTTEYTETKTTSDSLYVSGTSGSYYYGTSFSNNNGVYTLSGTLTSATIEECRNGTKTCGKYTLMRTSTTASSTKIYEVTDFRTSGNYITVNTTISANEFERNLATGLFKTLDDYGTSYYFRGDVENNYVQFGKWTENSNIAYWANGPAGEYYDSLEECEAGYNHAIEGEECKKAGALKDELMYWRIVRINGDGTIRLVYDGTTAVANSELHRAIITGTVYNPNNYDKKYVGYTYDDGNGNQVDSAIKGVVDEWYTNNLEKDYGKYIADSIFCNDRQINDYRYWDSLGNVTTNKEDAEDIEEFFAPYTRLVYNRNPQLTCTNQSDRYTAEDTTKGNGLLTYPVGLITADEVMLAGGNTTSNSNYYLYTGSTVDWTMSPYKSSDFGQGAAVGVVDGGKLRYHEVIGQYVNTSYTGLYAARPVINIKADILFSGSGTIDDPYKLAS